MYGLFSGDIIEAAAYPHRQQQPNAPFPWKNPIQEKHMKNHQCRIARNQSLG
jgi:hypothetical protein